MRGRRAGLARHGVQGGVRVNLGGIKNTKPR
jgi:hypothetical protein